MLNKLFLEQDGLIVGTNQLVASGDNISIGKNLVVGSNTYSGNIITNNLNVSGTAILNNLIQNATIVSGQSIGAGTTTIYTSKSTVVYYTTNLFNNFGLNFTYDVNVKLNDVMLPGQSINLSVLTPQGTTTYFLTSISIDGNSVTPFWLGGSAPSTGDPNAIGLYSFNIIKVSNNNFSVIASQSKYGQPVIPPGQQAYTSAGTYNWTVPAGVFSISVVAVGGGGGGNANWAAAAGSGGGLGWINNFAVIPGQQYTVVVGAGGSYGTGSNATAGGNSYFNSLTTVAGYGGGNATSGAATGGPNSNSTYGGGWFGQSGGAGGYASNYQGGGGAGGYAGNGGNGGNSGSAGSGGGGGGGSYYSSTYGTGAGGGVGILGQGANGLFAQGQGAGSGYGGGGGSGGQNSANGEPNSSTGSSGTITGGAYGGGGGGPGTSVGGGNGGRGAVRIIWGGTNIYRAFPAVNTADL